MQARILTIVRPTSELVIFNFEPQEIDMSERETLLSWGEGWATVREIILTIGFAPRETCLVLADTDDAPTDIALGTVVPHVYSHKGGGVTWHYGFVAAGEVDLLRCVSTSADFYYGYLRVFALLPTSAPLIPDFLVADTEEVAPSPALQTWLGKPATETQRYLQAQFAAKVASGFEFVESDLDGDNLTWFNPTPASLSACIAALQQLATAQQWQIQVDESLIGGQVN